MSHLKKTPLTDRALAGLRGQNDIATFDGTSGYWVQADCVFIRAASPEDAIAEYRLKVSAGNIACSHNRNCAGIREIVADRNEPDWSAT